MQIIEQTHEETVAMYMKCTKAQLAEMLTNCNEILAEMPVNVFMMKGADNAQSIQFHCPLRW